MREILGIGDWSRVAAIVATVALTSSLSLVPGATANNADASKTAQKSASTAAAKLDFNFASKAEWAKLPRIGEVYSQKIIDGRPYKPRAELKSKKVLPKSVYDKITPLIIAHQK